MFVRVHAVCQDDFRHFRAHVDRFNDITVQVHVLERVLGDGAPHTGLAVFGHGVALCDCHFGRFAIHIAFGDVSKATFSSPKISLLSALVSVACTHPSTTSCTVT